MNIDNSIFTNPTATAALAVALAWLAAQAARRWLDLPPIPVAVAVAAVIYLLGRYANAETQSVIIDLLRVLFAVLAASGVNVLAGKVRSLVAPDVIENEAKAMAAGEYAQVSTFWEVW